MTSSPPPTALLRTTRRLGPLRVTVVAPYAAMGGAEHWLLDLLDTVGDRVVADVVLLEDGPLREALDARGVPTTVIATGTHGADIARSGLRLWQILRRSEIDVVLANGIKAALAVAPAGRLAGVRVCWVKHDFSWDRELARPLGRAVDRVVATSTTVAEGAGREDTVIVPPPRPRPAADRATSHRFWSAHGVDAAYPGPTVAMLTRLVDYKGVDTAIRALATDDARDWRLVVAGPADPTQPGERDRLRALAADLGVTDRVVLTGDVDGAGRHLAAFDAIAVLTRSNGSRFGREAYSIVALEALRAGVPLLGAIGNPEVERMGRAAGVVVPPDDETATARGLCELRDPVVVRRCLRGAAEVMAAHPDAHDCAERVLTTLTTLALRPGAGSAGPPMTVLSCFKNEEGHVDGVVTAVLDQLGPDDEYLLVDDVSRDATGAELAAWAGRDPRIRLLHGPGLNAAAARNTGFAAARHPHVACIDAGCVPAPTWLSALRAPFAEIDPPDLVVGVYDLDGGGPRRDASRAALFPAVADSRRTTPFVWLSGRLTGRRFEAGRLDSRSMACTVEAWERAGGFDVELLSSEDAVFGDAVLASGGTSVLALDACVTWAQWDTVGEMVRTYVRYGEWGGRAGSWRLVRRDLVRAAAYVVGPVLVARGPLVARATVGAGAVGYVALPLRRLHDEDALTPATVALVPVVTAVKDLSKAWGCLRGMVSRAAARPGPFRGDGHA